MLASPRMLMAAAPFKWIECTYSLLSIPSIEGYILNNGDHRIQSHGYEYTNLASSIQPHECDYTNLVSSIQPHI